MKWSFIDVLHHLPVDATLQDYLNRCALPLPPTLDWTDAVPTSRAIITAIEKVNPKMPETVEAAEIKAEGVPGCIIEGPISYDLAMDAEAARIKGYQSPVAGEADILLMKDIVCGNVAAKTITVLGGGQTGGVVLGGAVLVVVGALHLLGPDGVVEKLRAKGYKVERVCSACASGR